MSNNNTNSAARDSVTWITNHPKPLASMWPRRKWVKYYEGRCKGTHRHTAEELEAMGYIGVYVAMSREEYLSHERVSKPQGEVKEA